MEAFFSFFNLQCSWETAVASFSALLWLTVFYLVWGYTKFQKRKLPKQPFQIADIFVTLFLIGWFLLLIISNSKEVLQISLETIGASVLIYFFLIIGLWGFLSWRNLSVIRIFQLNFSKIIPSCKKALLWLLAIYPLLIGIQSVQELLFKTGDDNQAIVHYFLNSPSWQGRLAVVIMALIIAPFAEEFIFRGYIYGVIRHYLGIFPALIISSLLFAGLHVHIPSLPGLMVLGIILALIYEITGSLWANICLHACFNTLSIILLILTSHYKNL